MYVLNVELDRVADGATRREVQQILFNDRSEAEAKADEFMWLVAAEFTHYLRNGDRLIVRECGLFDVEAGEPHDAQQQPATGMGRLLKHASGPGIR
jgi:hypothetical protein